VKGKRETIWRGLNQMKRLRGDSLKACWAGDKHLGYPEEKDG